jgi:hypothetical protein
VTCHLLQPMRSIVRNDSSLRKARALAQSYTHRGQDSDARDRHRTHLGGCSTLPQSHAVAPGNTTSATTFTWSESHEDMHTDTGRHVVLRSAVRTNTCTNGSDSPTGAVRFGRQRRSSCIKERDNRPEFAPFWNGGDVNYDAASLKSNDRPH